MGPDPGAFAELLAGYCLDVQPGQQVVVRSTTLAAPLLLAVQRAVLEREAWPLLRPELAEAEGTDASLGIQAPENTRALASVPGERMARAARARAAIREAGMRRRWCLTLWPTAAGAQ